MNELRPCPFCGSKAEPYILPANTGTCCSDQACNLHHLFFEIETWNTRPIEDHLHKQLEVAMEALEIFESGLKRIAWECKGDAQTIADGTLREAIANIEKIGVER